MRGNRAGGVSVAIVYRSMHKGGGAQKVVHTLTRGLKATPYHPFLVLYRRRDSELDLSGVDILPPRMAPGDKPWWWQVRFAVQLAVEVRRRGILIVHSHDAIGAEDRIALWLCHVLGARIIRTVHGELEPSGRGFGLLARWSNSFTDLWTVVSPDVVKSLVKYAGADSRRVALTPNGIDVKAFCSPSVSMAEIRAQLQVPKDCLLLVAVGRLAPEKNYMTMLDAFALVSRDVSDAMLVIAGEGGERPRLEQRIRDLNLCERVRLLGYRDDVADLLHAADIFVMSSQGEGMTLAAAEAMAAGIPVVATDVTGLHYVLDGGRAGILVPPQSPGDLAAAIVRLSRDAALRRELADKGRRRAFAEFSVETMVRRYEQLYEDVLAGRFGGRKRRRGRR